MYNEQLEELIEIALLDGELTEKEKQVLFNKAKSLGIDLDEFEMVLNARLYAIKKNKGEDISPKSDKYGDVKKCPACGSIVQPFKTVCDDCGHVFSNIDTSSSIKRLMKKLEDTELKRKGDVGSNALKALGAQFARAFGSVDKIEQEKKDIIRNFPIPNTKEDIVEFLALAVSCAKRRREHYFDSSDSRLSVQKHNEFVPVWYSKCEQIIVKAKFMLKDDPAMLNEIMGYAKELGIK